MVVGAARLEPMKLEPVDRKRNHIWRVTGEDGRQWVLKNLPDIPPGVAPVEEYRVLGYLQAAGLPVAAPIITDDGMIAFNANLRTHPDEAQPTGRHAYSLMPLLPNDPVLRESPGLANAAVVPLMLTIALAITDWHLHGPVRNLGAYDRDQRLIKWFTARYDALTNAATSY
jgi:hypothetical protein